MMPTEFEHLLRQLFEATGLDEWSTERSGSDGVDAVAISRNPFTGGLTIVQAKKYTAPVDVSRIHALAGLMDEKRAGRGVLVTTSWFSRNCWTQARKNGRIELIDGSRLRYLIKEHLQKDVVIPRPDRGEDVTTVSFPDVPASSAQPIRTMEDPHGLSELEDLRQKADAGDWSASDALDQLLADRGDVVGLQQRADTFESAARRLAPTDQSGSGWRRGCRYRVGRACGHRRQVRR